VDELADRLVDADVGAVGTQELGEGLEGVPGDGCAFVDREVPERFDQVALAGAGLCRRSFRPSVNRTEARSSPRVSGTCNTTCAASCTRSSPSTG
jgi:hypothetical protein